MFLGDVSTFCTSTTDIWRFIGKIIAIFKIVVPVILIVIGVIALGKALVSNDDKEIKTAFNSLLKKVIIGVVIFFIPTLVSAIIGLVDSDMKNDSSVCIKCITNPKDNAGCPKQK